MTGGVKIDFRFGPDRGRDILGHMTPKLPQELTDALHAAGDKPLSVIDPTTNHVYMVVDPSSPEAVAALQEQSDLAAIQRGIADMEAGRHHPVEEVFDDLKQNLRERSGQ
jgi:hypothetical protein